MLVICNKTVAYLAELYGYLETHTILYGHPRSVRLGYGDNKTRLYSSIRSKTPVIWWRGLHIGIKRSTAHILRTEVISLPAKGAVETISPAQSESAFYSRYFIVPKKDGGLRLILDLRLNRALMKWPLRMITSKQILIQTQSPSPSQSVSGCWVSWPHLPLQHGLQKEGGLDRHLQVRLGVGLRRQTGLRPLVEEGRLPSHQLPGKAGSMFGPSHLSTRPEGTSRLSPLGQYDGGVLHKLPGWSFLEAPLYSSRAPLEVGSGQLVLAESNACAGQTEPGSRHAISEQCPLRWVDAPPTNGSGNMGNLQQTRCRTLRLRRQHSLSNLFFEGHGCVCPWLAQPPPLRIPPITLISQVIRRIREQKLWRT